MPPNPTPSAEEILAWMGTTRQGAKAAATHFGMNVNTVRSLVRRARAKMPPGEVVRLVPKADPTPTPAPPPDAPDPTLESQIEFYSRKLKQLDEKIAVAKPREAAALFKQADVYFARYHALRAEAEAKARKNPREGIERLVHAIRSQPAAGGFPEAVVLEIEDAIAERRRPAV